MDDLCMLRCFCGKAGISIQIPAVSGVGMFANLTAHAGTSPSSLTLTPDSFTGVMERILAGEFHESVVCLLPSVPLPSTEQREFSEPSSFGTETNVEISEFKLSWNIESIYNEVRSSIALLMSSDSEVEDDVILMDQGLDSLKSTELSSKLSQVFGLRLLPTMVFNFPTVKDICLYITDELGIKKDVSISKVAFKPSVNTISNASFNHEEIAIVGVSLDLPNNIRNLDGLWNMRLTSAHCTTEVSRTRWDADSILAAQVLSNDESTFGHIRFGAFLTDDSLYRPLPPALGISKGEAKNMDDSQRLLLQCSFEALADYEEYNSCSLDRTKCGIFVGASGGLGDSMLNKVSALFDHDLALFSSNVEFGSVVYGSTSNSLAICAGRVAKALNCRGPTMVLDTACSSFLVALHTASRSLQNNECSSAIVAGVSVLGPSASLAFAAAGMLSPDGQCHTFDESANGYCRAEGCGAVVLKR
ncbi:hypothetical protein EON65_56900, partial [archaeon]